MRVAIKLTDLSDIPLLEKGLRLLNQSDPCVQVYIEDTGEHVLVTLGELHLKKCVDDLRKKFASGVAFTVSDPLVRFKETVTKSYDDSSKAVTKASGGDKFCGSKNHSNGSSKNSGIQSSQQQSISTGLGKHRERVQRQRTADQKFELSVRAETIPQALVQVLNKHGAALAALRRKVRLHDASVPLDEEVSREFHDVLETLPKCWTRYMQALWSVGMSERMGPNLLVNLINGCARLRLNWPWNSSDASTPEPAVEGAIEDVVEDNINSFVSGFQLACNRGPLCEEPMVGVCFVLQVHTLRGVIQSVSVVSCSDFCCRAQYHPR